MRSNMVKFIASVAGLCAIAAGNRAAKATIYIINPSESSLSVQVYSQGVLLTLPQYSGSDTASLSGSIDATVAGGNITFNSPLSSLAFGVHPGIYPDPTGGQPADGTVNALPNLPTQDPGDNIGSSQVANYGLQLIVPSDPSDPLNLDTAALAGYAAIDSALASLSGSSAFSGGVFSTNGLSLSVDSGNLDYNLNAGNGDGPPQTSSPFTNGTTGIGGNAGSISGAANGSIVSIGGGFGAERITIPVLVDVTVNTGLLVIDAVFSGQIVAVSAPEPSTFALAGLGLIALVPAVRRRLRKA